jgi:hypothetical protein
MPCWGADAGFFFIMWWYKLRQPCHVGVQTQDFFSLCGGIS